MLINAVCVRVIKNALEKILYSQPLLEKYRNILFEFYGVWLSLKRTICFVTFFLQNETIY